MAILPDGTPLVGLNGVWKPREDKDKKRVVEIPRWKDGSFLTEQQGTDEDYQTRNKIA